MDIQENQETQESLPEQQPKEGRKKSSLLGWISFGFMALSACAFCFVVLKALVAYLNHSIGADVLNLVTTGCKVAAALSFGGMISAIVCFFLRKQKKGLAVFSLIIALLIFALSGAIVYFYHYMFDTIEHDEEFNQLTKEELHVVEPSEDGSLRLDVQPEVESIPKEEVEENLSLQKLEWEYLLDTDIPEEALEKMNSQTPITPCYLRSGAEQIENYLLFGLDDQGSSDAIMILTMDRYHKKIKLISLARDSYVKIPEWGSYTKLTYAYNAGGAKTAVQTVNYNYILNIKDYITVDFNEIEQLVDLVGGVDVDLDYAELNVLNRFGHYGLTTGKNRLDGAAALLYSRIRASSATDNEANRTGRQREVLSSMFETAKGMPLDSYPELVRKCMELCTTSFESNELLAIAVEAVTNGYTIENYALIDHVDYWGGEFGSLNYFYVVYDLDGASNVLYRMIYEDLYASGYLKEKNQ